MTYSLSHRITPPATKKIFYCIFNVIKNITFLSMVALVTMIIHFQHKFHNHGNQIMPHMSIWLICLMSQETIKLHLGSIIIKNRLDLHQQHGFCRPHHDSACIIVIIINTSINYHCYHQDSFDYHFFLVSAFKDHTNKYKPCHLSLPSAASLRLISGSIF